MNTLTSLLYKRMRVRPTVPLINRGFGRLSQRVGIMMALGLMLAGCGANPQASPPPQPASSITPDPSATPDPSVTPNASATPDASATPKPSATPDPSATPKPSATPDPSATVAIPPTAIPAVARTTPAIPPAAVPTSPSIPGIGEIPEAILAFMIADLSQRAGVAPDAITVQLAEAVAWPDGSLGCPQPGMMYTQALVEGYRAVLVANGQTYAYHSDGEGNAFYCDQRNIAP